MEFECCAKNTTEQKEVSEFHDFLKIISNKNRLKIICMLKGGSRCVCEIFPILEISQKLTSHHLGKLKRAGLITEKREGNFIRYSLNKKIIKEHKKLFNKIIK